MELSHASSNLNRKALPGGSFAAGDGAWPNDDGFLANLPIFWLRKKTRLVSASDAKLQLCLAFWHGISFR
jgi:hypothetical protein